MNSGSKVSMSLFATALFALAAVSPTAAPTAYAAAMPRAAVDSPAAFTQPIIAGGTRSSVPWAVQVTISVEDAVDPRPRACTGIQINESWVLTARHCTNGGNVTTVYQSDSRDDRGKAHPTDEISNAPTGDMTLVHLAEAAPLASYPALDMDHVAETAGRGTVYGFGDRDSGARSDGLYEANVRLEEASTDIGGADAQGVRGINGISRPGDSGGPLVVDGAVVGVCSLVFQLFDTPVHQGGADYTLLSDSADWIRQTAGLTAEGSGRYPASVPVLSSPEL